ncbi:hypothetical protein BH23ACT5_BH23ACT5_21170 [soil metagenome]
MELKAVVDRMEGDLAVLLVNDSEAELHVPMHYLPPGTKAGAWLRISFRADPAGEAETRERVDTKMDKLRQRGGRLDRD